MRILVVEDEPAIAELLREAVEDLGHEVCGVARGPREAAELIAGTRPDALIVDVDLGEGASGVDVAVQAYMAFGLRSLFVSGRLDGWTVRQARAIRPYGFLAKPFGMEELAEAIGRLD
jgi:DNA-binding response OmpR family regulator